MPNPTSGAIAAAPGVTSPPATTPAPPISAPPVVRPSGPAYWLLGLVLLAAFPAAGYVLAAQESAVLFGDFDARVYTQVAKEWSRGAVPYRDLVDHKPPGVYLFYQWCFWQWGDRPIAVWRGLCWLTVLSGGLLFAGLWAIGRPVVALVAGWGLVFLLHPDSLHQRSANTGQVANLGICAMLCAAWLYQRFGRWWLAGLAGACAVGACLGKQPAALLTPAAGLILLGRHAGQAWRAWLGRSARAVLWAIIGAAVVLGLTLGYFALHGALGDFYTWVWQRNIDGYVTRATTQSRQNAWNLCSTFVRTELFRWPEVIHGWVYLVGPLVGLVAVALRGSWLGVCTVVLAAGGAAATLSGTGFYPHYLAFLHVPAVLLIGLGVEWIAAVRPEAPRRAYLGRCLAGVAAFVLVSPAGVVDLWTKTRQTLAGERPGKDEVHQLTPAYRLGAALRSQAGAGTRVIPIGDQVLDVLFYGDLRPDGRFMYVPPYARTQADVDEQARQIAGTSARFVILDAGQAHRAHDDAALRAVLEREFERWPADRDPPGSAFVVYERRSASSAPAAGR